MWIRTPSGAVLGPLLVGLLGSCVGVEGEGFLCSDEARCPAGLTCSKLDHRCYRYVRDAASEAQDVAPAPDSDAAGEDRSTVDAESDAQPECDDFSPPRCSGPGERKACSSHTWTTIACPPATPACIEGVGCTACTEHDQCPGSACHLSGPKQGTCFDPSHVVIAGQPSDLLDAVSSLSTPGELAILLRASVPMSQQIQIGTGQEVAIVGEPSVTWSGKVDTTDRRMPMIQVLGGTLYFARVRLEDAAPLCSAIGNADDGILWIDDAFISGYSIAVNSGGSELHVRRSFLRGDMITMSVGRGTLFMHTSVVAPVISNLGGNAAAGINVGSAGVVVDIRYSTIIGGAYAIDCAGYPQPSGSIRNSILLDLSTQVGVLSAACNTINQAGNYAPDIYYTARWFVNAAGGDFRLSPGGQAAVVPTAQWSPGDPTVDIDGTPRPPTGYSGIDQP